MILYECKIDKGNIVLRLAVCGQIDVVLVYSCEIIKDEICVGLDSKDIVDGLLVDVLYYYQEFIPKNDFLAAFT